MILFSASYDDTLKVWKEDGDEWYCSYTLSGHTSTVWGLSLKYDNFNDSIMSASQIASCSDDNSVIIWQSEELNFEGNWLKYDKVSDVHKFSIYSIDWSHDNNKILTAGGDNAITLISLSSNRGCDGSFDIEKKIENAHDNDINCIRWNPNTKFSSFFSTCSDDGTLKIWKLTYT